MKSFEIVKANEGGSHNGEYYVVADAIRGAYTFLCRDGKIRSYVNPGDPDESLYYYPDMVGAEFTIVEYGRRNQAVTTNDNKTMTFGAPCVCCDNKPKRVLVVGAGRQGTCVAWALSELGYDVDLFDDDSQAIERAIAKIRSIKTVQKSDIKYIQTTYIEDENIPGKPGKQVPPKLDGIAAIVSCAPYYKNLEYAKLAREHSLPYVDLGGNVGVSKAIAELEGTSPVFTDVGLAPGLVSIIAENLYQMLVYNSDKAHSIGMSVGGLPVIPPSNSFRYNQVFSMDGLLNEYFDDCKILQDGMELTIPGMSQYVNTDEYEAFATSGGLGSMLPLMKGRGVENLIYRTMRYPGHRDAIDKLLEKWDKDNGRERIAQELGWACPPTIEDKVVLGVTIEGEKFTVHYDNEWFFDENWTAMQKMTAFPVACVMSQMLQKPDRFGSVCDYSQVSYSELTTDLKKLGVSL